MPPRRGVSVGRHGAPSPRWWWCGFTALYQDGGGRLPARASPIRDPDRGGQAEAAALGVREQSGASGCSRAPALRPPARWSRGRLRSCHKCQVLSPVGAPKLLPRTAEPQRRASPRVPPTPGSPRRPRLPCSARRAPPPSPRAPLSPRGTGHVFLWETRRRVREQLEEAKR